MPGDIFRFGQSGLRSVLLVYFPEHLESFPDIKKQKLVVMPGALSLEPDRLMHRDTIYYHPTNRSDPAMLRLFQAEAIGPATSREGK